jgi:hypothetical protein
MAARSRRLHTKLWIPCLILLMPCSHESRAEELPTNRAALEDDQPTRPPGEKPVDVGLVLRIIDFARINVREEFYEVHAYLEASWVDERTKVSPGSLADKDGTNHWRKISPSARIWMPNFTFTNAAEDVKIQNPNLFADNEGNMLRSFEFNGKFSKPLEFRNFSFDCQDLHIYIQVYAPERGTITLSTKDGESFVQDGAFLPDWELGESAAWIQADTDRVDHSSFETFIMETKVNRRATFYIYRVLLPLTLLVVGSWCVFWFDVTQLQPQISTSLSIMLSNVMFSFGIDFGLPRLPYLTAVDRHALLSFLFAFVTIAGVTYLHVTLRHRGPEATQVRQRRIRILFPIAYLISLLIAHTGG